MTRKSVAFNPHWIESQPAWDIVLPRGIILRSVTKRDINSVVSRYVDVVRDCDIQEFGRIKQKLRSECL